MAGGGSIKDKDRGEGVVDEAATASEAVRGEEADVATVDDDNNKDGGDTTRTFWYFAIGSMMNPTSMRGRGIVPLESRPGKLLDYRINFFGPMGYAEAVPAGEDGGLDGGDGSSSPSSSSPPFHGVVHLTDETTMAALDRMEIGYVRKPGKARLYGGTCGGNGDGDVDVGTIVDVTVYSRPDGVARGPDVDRPPQQFYLELMTEGAEHFGVDEGYVKFLRGHPYQPRASPLEFRSFGDPPDGSPTFTLEEVRSCNGRNGTPLRITVNGKVKEYAAAGEGENAGSKGDLQSKLLHFFDRFGQVEELFLSKVQYDPKYGVPDRLGDFTREHAGYVEHMSYTFADRMGSLGRWKVVGSFRQTYKDD